VYHTGLSDTGVSKKVKQDEKLVDNLGYVYK